MEVVYLIFTGVAAVLLTPVILPLFFEKDQPELSMSVESLEEDKPLANQPDDVKSFVVHHDQMKDAV